MAAFTIFVIFAISVMIATIQRPLLSCNWNIFQTQDEFCQIHHFRPLLHFIGTPFVTSFKVLQSVWQFFARFAIFATAYISGHVSEVTIIEINIYIPFHQFVFPSRFLVIILDVAAIRSLSSVINWSQIVC